MIRGVVAMSSVTLRELSLRPELWLVAVLSLLLLISASSFNYFWMAERDLMLTEAGLATTRLALLLCVLICASVVLRPQNPERLWSLLSKPLSRLAFVVGKYLGMISAMLVLSASLTLVLVVLLFLSHGAVPGPVLLASFGELLQASLLLAVATVVAPHVRPIVSVTGLTLLFLTSHLSETIRDASASLTGASLLQAMLSLAPDFPQLTRAFRGVSQSGLGTSSPMLFLTTLYALGYVLCCLLIASYVYSHRDVP